MNPTRQPPRHVIFLGAGASYSSGYPVGDSLRLRLSCRKRFQAELRSAIGGMMDDTVEACCSKHFEIFGSAIELFRNGGFSTVDEFSKLVARSQPKQTQAMKKLMRSALAFHNPENNFHESDYYAFVQRLFRDDDLHNLKSHITIISYNYDCYLDYLLLRAYRQRKELVGITNVEKPIVNKLTSGFYYPHDTSLDSNGFNYYKLHGSIAYGDTTDFSINGLFERQSNERLAAMTGDYCKTNTPPMVFPWELFDDDDNYIGEEYFVFIKGVEDRGKQAEGKMLYELYRKTWLGARAAVEAAHKISFVGLSAHPYMERGLEYLFRKAAAREVQVVVANTDNAKFKDFKNRLHPASLCGRVAAALQRVAPDLKYVKSQSEDDGVFTMEHFEQAKNGEWRPDITPRYSFKEFIQTEMD